MSALRRHWFTVASGTGARRAFANWPSMATLAVVYIIVIGVVTALWRAATDANDGSVAGYTGLALSWYLIASEAVYVTLSPRTIEEIGEDIADGTVATELLRPASVVGVRVATQMGWSLARLTILLPLGIAFGLLVVGPPPSGTGLVLALPAMVIGVVVNLLLQHTVAAASFWIRDARSSWFFYQKLIFMLGGMLVPLEVLPSALHTVASFLPFMAVTYVPARLMSGHIEPWLFAVQLAWLAAAALAARAAFGAGERRLQVVGG